MSEFSKERVKALRASAQIAMNDVKNFGARQREDILRTLVAWDEFEAKCFSRSRVDGQGRRVLSNEDRQVYDAGMKDHAKRLFGAMNPELDRGHSGQPVANAKPKNLTDQFRAECRRRVSK